MRWLRTVLIATVLFLLLVALAICTLLFSPKAQTWALAKFAVLLAGKTGFAYKTGPVWLDVRRNTLELKAITITDPQGHAMIEAPYLKVAYTLQDVLRGGFRLDSARVQQSVVRIITNEKLAQTNITLFVDTLDSWLNPPPKGVASSADTLKSNSPSQFIMRHVTLQNCRLILSNESRDTIPTGIDYNHFNWEHLSGTLHNFRIRADTLQFMAQQLATRDTRTQWPVAIKETQFRYTRHQMRFTGLNLKAGKTHVLGQLAFYYQHARDLSDFEDKIYVQSTLRKSIVHARDIAMFAKPINRYKDVVTLNKLTIEGGLHRFKVKEFDLSFGSKSTIRGYLSIAGLPEAKPLKLQVKFISPFLHPPDLHPYLPKDAQKHIDGLGDMAINGTFSGTQKVFDASINLNGNECGHAEVHTRMDLDTTLTKASYTGTISTKSFEFGKLLNRKLLGKLTCDADIKGRGLIWKTADITVKAKIKELEIIGIPLRRFRINAEMDKRKILQLLSGVRPGLGKEDKKDTEAGVDNDASKPEAKSKKKKKKFLFF